MKTAKYIVFLVGSSVLSVWSEPVQYTPEASNAVMSRRAELVMQKSDAEQELAQAWLDASFTSDAIVAARKKYRDLLVELEHAKQEIQKAVLALPVNQEKQKKLDAMKCELDALNKKADEMRRATGISRRAGTNSVPVSVPVK